MKVFVLVFIVVSLLCIRMLVLVYIGCLKWNWYLRVVLLSCVLFWLMLLSVRIRCGMLVERCFMMVVVLSWF